MFAAQPILVAGPGPVASPSPHSQETRAPADPALRCRALHWLLGLTCGLAFPGLAARAAAAEQDAARTNDLLVYVGTYTGEKSKGIQAFRFDTTTGIARPLGCVAETTHPSFLTIHPTGPYLYAVSEVASVGSGGKRSGAVAAFRMDPQTGGLTPLNQESSGGTGPCHLTVDRTGRHVLVANYSGGSVASLPVREDGSLGPATVVIQHTGSSVNPMRQERPHAHSVNLSPDNRFAFVADLGTDRVMIYRFDAARGTLEPHDPPFVALEPGSGPRHLAIHPDGRRVFVVNELLNTLAAFDLDAAHGSLALRQTVGTLPDGFTGNSSTAEVAVHPDGHLVFVSNRGHDSLAGFALDSDGHLQSRGYTPTEGRTPRHFAMDPSGRYVWVANQASDTVVIFRVGQVTGKLEALGVPLEVGSPVCVRFVPPRPATP